MTRVFWSNAPRVLIVYLAMVACYPADQYVVVKSAGSPAGRFVVNVEEHNSGATDRGRLEVHLSSQAERRSIVILKCDDIYDVSFNWQDETHLIINCAGECIPVESGAQFGVSVRLTK